MSNNKEKINGKRVVAKGLGWRKLAGDDNRHIWDPKDKERVKSLVPTWIFQVIAIVIFLLLAWLGVMPTHK